MAVPKGHAGVINDRSAARRGGSQIDRIHDSHSQATPLQSNQLGIPFTAPEGRGTPAWWTPLDTRSLDLITRARFRRWTNASVTTRPAASTSVVCAGLKDSPAPIAERRGSHG